VHRRNTCRQGLSYLAHALGQVFVGTEHVAFRHVKLDIATRVFQDFANKLVGLETKGLAYGVQEHADKVYMSRKPLIYGVYVKLVAETSISEAGSVYEDDLLEVARSRRRSLYSHAIEKAREALLLAFFVVELFHEGNHFYDVVTAELGLMLSVHDEVYLDRLDRHPRCQQLLSDVPIYEGGLARRVVADDHHVEFLLGGPHVAQVESSVGECAQVLSYLFEAAI